MRKNKPTYEWEFIVKENGKMFDQQTTELWVMLNGGVNKILDMKQENYKAQLADVLAEIEYYKPMTKTTVNGLDKILSV